MKYLVGLVLILGLAAGGAYVVAGRMGGPPIQIASPEKFVGVSTPVQFTRTGPAGRAADAHPDGRAERQAVHGVHARRRRGRGEGGSGRPPGDQDDREAGDPRAAVRPGPHFDLGVEAGPLRHPHGREHGDARRPGPTRTTAGVRGLHAPLHQPRRIRGGGLPRHAGRRHVGCGCRRHRIPRLPALGSSRCPESPRTIPRSASRSSRCATTRTSTRRSASSPATKRATWRAPSSTSASSRNPSSAAASIWTMGSWTAWCRRSSKGPPT